MTTLVKQKPHRLCICPEVVTGDDGFLSLPASLVDLYLSGRRDRDTVHMQHGGCRHHYDPLEKASLGLGRESVLTKPVQSLRAHSNDSSMTDTRKDINKAYLLREEMNDHTIVTDGLARSERGKGWTGIRILNLHVKARRISDKNGSP
jgi:hypothetical protein